MQSDVQACKALEPGPLVRGSELVAHQHKLLSSVCNAHKYLMKEPARGVGGCEQEATTELFLTLKSYTRPSRVRGILDFCADKTPNHPSLNLSNFTKVTLQTGKDSLRGLLCGSQDLQARGESQIRL